MSEPRDLPPLLTPDDVAQLLQTSKRSVYSMAERAQLAGALRIGRRLRFRRDDLLSSLRLSLKETRTWL
ncbi:MAG: helix-turn-helix domain-containing protein [bacterium]